MENFVSVDLMSFIHKSINCTINADKKKKAKTAHLCINANNYKSNIKTRSCDMPHRSILDKNRLKIMTQPDYYC